MSRGTFTVPNSVSSFRDVFSRRWDRGAPSAPTTGSAACAYPRNVMNAWYIRRMPIFSPDGAHAACDVMFATGGHGVWHDGEILAGKEAQFLADGRLAYVAWNEDRCFAKVGDRALKEYEGVDELNLGNPLFSPDGNRRAYAASPRFDRWQTVLDDNTGPEFRRVHNIRFSLDSCRCGYLADSGKNMFVVVEDRDGRMEQPVAGEEEYREVLEILLGPADNPRSRPLHPWY